MAKVSVLMGVYNNASTLPAALESLIAQTFCDWELIVCDDGSQDESFAILTAYKDKYPHRITLLQNKENLGLNATLNRCLLASRGEYIARQDGDDLSLPERFAKEAAVLDTAPDIALVSSAMILFDEKGDWGISASKESPTAADFMRGSPFCHAACMMRRGALLSVGGYSEGRRFERVEDYHLWYKLYRAGFKGHNLQEPLYRARDGRDAQARRTVRNRFNEAYIRWLCFCHLKPPVYTLPLVLRPLLVLLMPPAVYRHLHRKRLQSEENA